MMRSAVFLLLCIKAGTAIEPTTCCQRGFVAGSDVLNKGATCKPADADTHGFDGFDKVLCAGFFKSCCEFTARNVFCQNGRQAALAKQSCVKSSNPYGDEAKTCCDCCKLGLQKGSSTGDCKPHEEDNINCNIMYSECCKHAKKQGHTTSRPVTTCRDVTCDPSTSESCYQDRHSEPTCPCKLGYENKGPLVCVDINECETGKHTCTKSQRCANTPGGFSCHDTPCEQGYVLQGGKCVDEDECQSGKNLCRKGSYCANTEGSYNCWSNCPSPNYKVVSGTFICVDVDECATSTPCSKHFECVNTVGSYQCKRTGCEAGFRFDNGRCTEIDECKENPNICGQGGNCYNSYGSYYCDCVYGYELDKQTGKCVDMDECKNAGAYCSYKCVNTIGSYRCECPPGYTVDGSYCNDIDECSTSPCGSELYCFNYYGSYACINMTCPNRYYQRKEHNVCEKIDCDRDRECHGYPEESYKWVSYKFYKTVKPKSFLFTYWTRFSPEFDVQYNLVSGNEGGYFYIDHLSREKIQITNGKSIEGPKIFHLVLHTDILRNGVLNYRYVYTFHCYVGEHNFG